MDQYYAIARRMVEMQKSTFDNMLGSMITFWDQAGSMLDWTVGFPEKGKRAFREWIETNKKGCENLKATVSSGYSHLIKFFENPTGK